MSNENRFVCGHCGAVHDNDLELLSLNGVNFCSKCSDSFHFINDEYLGIIVLEEVDSETFNKMVNKVFIDRL